MAWPRSQFVGSIRLVNILTLALTHGLIALALVRMLTRKGLDPKDDVLNARQRDRPE